MARISAKELMARDDIREQFAAHAAEWFPRECCGLLIVGEEGGRAVLAENLQDKYHKLDPEAFSRTAETAYLLDPRLLQAADDAGEDLIAIVHSHCKVGAYFSDEDIARARSPFEDGPLYPGVDYVVLDAQQDGLAGYKIFGWSDEKEEFVER